MTHSILIVDDEATLSKNISKYLGRSGFDCRRTDNGEEALLCLDQFNADLVLLDYALPGMSGLDALKRIRDDHPALRVVFITGHSSVQLAVDAMKAGADDYVNKPISLEELKMVIERVLGRQRIENELNYYRRKEATHSGVDLLLGHSPVMQEVRNTIRKCLDAESRITKGAPASVLITGETGTGKELVARAFHFDGPRHKQPFIEINCAAIPSQLMEAEVFGYERGAFTGASQRKAGLVESAEKGTLFLDEIGDMEHDLQAKLLSLLENHRFRRVGGLQDREVDIRIIAATNQDLDQLVARKLFRPDLLFRLRVIHVKLPPLRERGEDAVLLARHFVEQQCERYGREAAVLEPEAMQTIKEHSWPGNVRELRNVIENAVMLIQGKTVKRRHLAIPPATATRDATEIDSSTACHSALDQTEVKLLLEALRQSKWNISGAARTLGISRDTLRYRIKKHKLEDKN
jgi:DNA-binding NtrC family response regulator